MAIVRPCQFLPDDVVRPWAKIIGADDQFDPDQRGGYALTGPWVGGVEYCALEARTFLVCAGEIWERRRAARRVSALVLGTLDAPRVIPAAEQLPLIQLYGTEHEIAGAMNSALYRMGCYARLWLRGHGDDAPAPAPVPVEGATAE